MWCHTGGVRIWSRERERERWSQCLWISVKRSISFSLSLDFYSSNCILHLKLLHFKRNKGHPQSFEMMRSRQDHVKFCWSLERVDSDRTVIGWTDDQRSGAAGTNSWMISRAQVRLLQVCRMISDHKFLPFSNVLWYLFFGHVLVLCEVCWSARIIIA